MAISSTQITDYLYKKVGFGVTKTDTSTAKYPFNESIASPLLTPGQYVWQQDYAIPVVTSAPSANTVVNGQTIVSVYNASTSAVVQASALTESITNETWSTGITNWIPPSFGSGYQLKLYAGPSGASAATAVQYTNLPVGGVNSDSWFFDYQSGIINFADTNVPSAVTGANVVYVLGAVYTGSLGITNYANLNVTGNLTSTNGNIVLTTGNVTAQNYYGNGAYLTGVAGAASGNVSFYSQITPLSNNQTYYLEFANLTTGNSVTGAVTSVNVNPSTGTISATAFSGTTGTLGGTLSVTGATTLTTATTGGLQAVAIGNVTPGTGAFTTLTAQTESVGGLQAVAIGNVTPGTGAFTTQTTGGLQAVAIGNVTPGTGAFTTQTTGGLQAVAIGNVTPGSAVFTSVTAQTESVGGLQAVAIGNVTPGTGAFTTQTTGGLQAVAIGNVTPGTGAFTTGTFSSTLGVTGATTLTTATTGGLQAVAIGNVTPGTAVFTTQSTGGLQAVAIGNVTPGTGVFTTSTFNTATTGGLQAVAIGNVTPGTGAFTTGTFSSTLGVTGATTLTTATTGGLQAVAIGNVTPGTGAFTSVTAQTESVGGLQAVAIGNVTPGTGAFTTLNASGITSITNNTNAIGNTGSGALQIAGGVGIAQDLWVGGNVYAGNLISQTTSILEVTDPLVYLNASNPSNYNYEIGFYSHFVGGGANNYQHTGLARNHNDYSWYLVSNISEPANGTMNFTYANIVYDTLRLGAITLSNIGNVINTMGSANIASNVYTGNLNATGVYGNLYGTLYGTVAGAAGTANVASYIQTVTASSNASYYPTFVDKSSGNVLVYDNTALTFNPSTGTLSSTTFSGAVTATTGTFSSTLGVTGATTLTTATTGGLQAVAIGNVTPGTGAFTTITASSTLGVTGATTLTTATVGGLQAVAIGNVTPGSGAFTTLSTTGNLTVGGNISITGNIVPSANITYNLGTPSNRFASIYVGGQTIYVGGASIGSDAGGNLTLSVGNGNQITLGNAQANNAIFTGNLTSPTFFGNLVATTINATGASTLNTVTGASLQATAIGNVTPGTAAFTTTTTGGLQAVAIGNVTPGTAAFTTGTFSSTLGVTGATTMTTATAGGLQAVAIGNVTPGTATFTIATTGGLQAVAIGNVTPGTGAFTTGTFSSTLGVTGATTMTTATTGGLQAVAIGNVTPGSGAFTSVTAQTESVGGLQAVAIGNVTPGSGVFTSVTAQTESVGGLQAVAIGNVTPGLGFFTTANATTVYAATIGNATTSITGATGTFSSYANVTATTQSTSTTTGALIVNGGVGIAKDVYVGGNITTTGAAGNISGVNTVFASTIQATTVNAATIGNTGASINGTGTNLTSLTGANVNGTVATANVSYYKVVNSITTNQTFYLGFANVISGNSTFNATTLVNVNPSTSTIYASAFVGSGSGLTGNAVGLTVGNATNTVSATNATNTSIGIASGTDYIVMSPSNSGYNGLGVRNALTYTTSTDTLTVNNLTASAVVINGGVASTSYTTGALTVTGGVGVQGNLFVNTVGYFGPGNSTIGLTNPLAVFTGNVNGYTQVQIQNTNAGGANTSADFIATAPNGTDTTNYIDMGINGNAWNTSSWTVSGANDGYLYVDGGNLTLGTDTVGKTVVIHVGGTYANNIVATFSANNIGATSGNVATMAVVGGLGLIGTAGNIYATGTGGSTLTSGLIVNNGQASAGTTGTANQNAFIVRGVNDSTLVYAKPLSAYDAVIIGGNASTTSFSQGAKLVVNSTDSILLPIGTSAQRPSSSGGTDTAGMLRYSTTTGGIEWYNGTTWATASTSFTVIADQQFTGTGSQTVFTLNSSQTTASCIVSINGVIQFPTLAYSVSTTSLTFTEAPAATDVIDVRMLTTTSTVIALNDSTGYNSVNTITGTGITFTTGTSSATTQYTIDLTGGIASTVPNVTVATASSATTVDSFYANTYSTAKYILTSTLGSTKEATEALVITNGTVANIVIYGTINTAGNSLTSWSAVMSGNIAQLKATTTNNNTVIRMTKQYNAI